MRLPDYPRDRLRGRRRRRGGGGRVEGCGAPARSSPPRIGSSDDPKDSGIGQQIYARSNGRNTGVVVCCPRKGATTPLGLSLSFVPLPRVARSSQPWALRRNPFGIGFRNETL